MKKGQTPRLLLKGQAIPYYYPFSGKIKSAWFYSLDITSTSYYYLNQFCSNVSDTVVLNINFINRFNKVTLKKKDERV